YYVDVNGAKRLESSAITAGARVTVLGTEAARSHEITALAVSSGDAAALVLALMSHVSPTPATPAPSPSPTSPIESTRPPTTTVRHGAGQASEHIPLVRSSWRGAFGRRSGARGAGRGRPARSRRPLRPPRRRGVAHARRADRRVRHAQRREVPGHRADPARDPITRQARRCAAASITEGSSTTTPLER